ncbi:DUF664 domain-containing protein [Rhodococcus fascians]|nr:DUF664 domain-containing protein [Rhodococcus fascians]MBY4238679.1 DUF664 domain-containing protein [Rhodococcus fascians]MBY4254732.1 DUF664 domain-containing protein [Rhodococcus fascians]MBY4270034.1 DUF664 domain-containing protein [Rhodococcus fascians]
MSLAPSCSQTSSYVAPVYGVAPGPRVYGPVVQSEARPEFATATPEWVLTHLVRELAQHLSQLELTRDVLRRV